MRCQFIALLADGKTRPCRQTATCTISNGRLRVGSTSYGDHPPGAQLDYTTVDACARHARLVSFQEDRVTVKLLGYGMPLRRRTDGTVRPR